MIFFASRVTVKMDFVLTMMSDSKDGILGRQWQGKNERRASAKEKGWPVHLVYRTQSVVSVPDRNKVCV